MDLVIWNNFSCSDLGNSSSGVGSCPTDSAGRPDSTLSRTLLSIFLGLMTVCGVVGNVLVILSVALTRKLRTVTNCFIVSLAVADLLVAIFVMPISAFVEVTGEWWFGPLVCWIFISADVFLCTSSIWNLLIISLERCMAISWPLWYGARRTRRLALYLIAIAWIVSMVICLPPLLLQGMLEKSMENGHCSYAIDEGYRIYSASGSFWIPLAIILFCYIRIFAVANRKDKLLSQEQKCNGKLPPTGKPDRFLVRPSNPSSESPEHNMLMPNGISVKHALLFRATSITETQLDSATGLIEIRMDEIADPLSRASINSIQSNGILQNGKNGYIYSSERKKRISETRGHHRGRRNIRSGTHVTGSSIILPKKQLSFKDRERKVFKVLLIIFCSFVACWMGFFVIYTLEPFCTACKEIDKRVYAFFLWLGYFNSMLNPLIYAGFSKDFRTAFLNILACKCVWSPSRKKRASPASIRPRRLVVVGR